MLQTASWASHLFQLERLEGETYYGSRIQGKVTVHSLLKRRPDSWKSCTNKGRDQKHTTTVSRGSTFKWQASLYL